MFLQGYLYEYWLSIYLVLRLLSTIPPIVTQYPAQVDSLQSLYSLLRAVVLRLAILTNFALRVIYPEK